MYVCMYNGGPVRAAFSDCASQSHTQTTNGCAKGPLCGERQLVSQIIYTYSYNLGLLWRLCSHVLAHHRPAALLALSSYAPVQAICVACCFVRDSLTGGVLAQTLVVSCRLVSSLLFSRLLPHPRPCPLHPQVAAHRLLPTQVTVEICWSGCVGRHVLAQLDLSPCVHARARIWLLLLLLLLLLSRYHPRQMLTYADVC